jgi:hypothetical protein
MGTLAACIVPLVEALAVGTSVKSREGLHKVRGSTVLACCVNSGEFDNVSMLGFPRVKNPSEKKEEENPSYIEHACGLRGNLNHGSSSKNGLIES